MVSRLKLQYCKVIIATSLVWFMVDVFLLMYFTDCTADQPNCDRAAADKKDGTHSSPAPGILGRLLPNGEPLIPLACVILSFGERRYITLALISNLSSSLPLFLCCRL
jgi:hypothetical protein